MATMRPMAGGVLALLAVLASGCGTDVEPLAEQPGAPPVQRLVVGRIEPAKPEFERWTRQYRRALVAHLRDSKHFAEVVWPAPMSLPADAAMISGVLSEVDGGNETLRYLIGFGVGGPSLAGRFTITDATGGQLALFDQSAHSGDGDGFTAHWNQVYMEDEVDAFAAATAEALVRWSQGEGLDDGWRL
jgi:hypothetical protein